MARSRRRRFSRSKCLLVVKLGDNFVLITNIGTGGRWQFSSWCSLSQVEGKSRNGECADREDRKINKIRACGNSARIHIEVSLSCLIIECIRYAMLHLSGITKALTF